MTRLIPALGRLIFGNERYESWRTGDAITLEKGLRFQLKQSSFPLRIVTARWRVLPDYLIIGVQKGGTSSLFYYLHQHPAIAESFYKEPAYFAHTADERSLSWYRAMFPLASQMKGRIAGEGSTDYLSHPEAAQRAAALVPDAKIIVLLRDPVTRAYSHYQHNVLRGHESRSFADALQAELETQAADLNRLGGPDYPSIVRFLYLARGHYHDQLVRWLAVYPRDRFLILPSEQLYADESGTLAKTLLFLGQDPAQPREVRYKVERKGTYTAPMSEETRAWLAEYFRPHNAKLFDLLGESYNWTEPDQA